MKLFRRISVLALVAVMVCLFSASAFAATSFSDLKVYDDNYETYIDVYANIYQDSTLGALSLTAVGLQQSHLRAGTYYWFYSQGSGLPKDGEDVRILNDDTYCAVSSWTDSAGILEMIEATHYFYASFTAYHGTFTYEHGDIFLEY